MDFLSSICAAKILDGKHTIGKALAVLRLANTPASLLREDKSLRSAYLFSNWGGVVASMTPTHLSVRE